MNERPDIVPDDELDVDDDELDDYDDDDNYHVEIDTIDQAWFPFF